MSLGPCLAARSLGLPVVLHEAKAVPGLANRVLAATQEIGSPRAGWERLTFFQAQGYRVINEEN